MLIKLIVSSFPFACLYTISGISVIDELIALGFIIYIIFFGERVKWEPRNFLNIFFVASLSICLWGLLFWDIKGLRVGVLFLAMLFLKEHLDKLYLENFRYMILGTTIAVLYQIWLSGISVNTAENFYAEDWAWQSTVWAGTAYAAYVFGAMYLLILMHPKAKATTINQAVLFMLGALILLASIGMDSRMLLYTMMATLPIPGYNLLLISFRKTDSALRLNLSTFLLFSIAALIAGSIFSVSLGGGLPSILGTDGDLEEKIESVDRLVFILRYLEYVQSDFLRALLPQGLYSHQYILIDFIDYGGGNRVRPTGIIAVLVDFGILLTLSLGIWLFKVSLRGLRSPAMEIQKKIIFLLFIAFIPFSLLITNLHECMLFFVSLLFLDLVIRNNFSQITAKPSVE